MYQFQAGHQGFPQAYPQPQQNCGSSYPQQQQIQTSPPVYAGPQQPQYPRYGQSIAASAHHPAQYPAYPSNQYVAPLHTAPSAAPQPYDRHYQAYSTGQPSYFPQQQYNTTYATSYAQQQYYALPNTGPQAHPYAQPPQFGGDVANQTIQPYHPQPLACQPHNQTQMLLPPQPKSVSSSKAKEYPKAKPTENFCYNCGDPSHWAQDCPEPRRAVPVGEMNKPHPFKRQKTTGSFETQYQHQNQAPPILQRGWTHPFSGPRRPSDPSGPLTPSSNTGQGQSSWPQHAPHHADHNFKHVAQQPPQPQTHGIPTPVSPHEFPFSNPGAPSTYVSHIPDHHNTQRPYGHVPPSTQPISSSPAEIAQLLSPNDSKYPPQITSYETPQSIRHNSNTSEHVEENADVEESTDPILEDLEALDKIIEKSSVAPPLHPAVQTQRPLSPPSGDVEHPSREQDDMLQQPHTTAELILDPIYATIDAGSDVITFHELIARRNYETGTEEQDYDEHDGFYGYRDYSASEHDGNSHVDPDDLGREDQQLNPARETETEIETDLLAREQEERLAALGVTGPAKPVRTSAHKTKAIAELPRNRNHVVSMETERMNVKGEYGRKSSSHKPGDNEKSDIWTGNPDRHKESSAKLRNTYLHGPSNSPREMVKQQEPQSTHETSRGQSRGSQRSSSLKSPGPPTMTEDSSRKRTFRQSIEESDEGPKRQDDESMQRTKRKAPKVAAAYSRRW